MSYTANQAIKTLNGYLEISDENKTIIDGTNNRGFVLLLPNSEEKVVIFVYPLVHKKDGTKTFFDTRDSGAAGRAKAWNYAIDKNLKYFCLGVNDVVTTYKDYIFSLECNEQVIEKISGTLDGVRNGRGNQIIIPISYKPEKNIDRIVNKLGIYISVIHKSFLKNYLRIYDNRPYMLESSTVDVSKIIESVSDKRNEYSVDKGQKHFSFITNFQSPFSRNRIIFGAPGTGKSFQINEDVKKLLENGGKYERVTFHPDYSYANFVGTYKPVPYIREDEERGITYEYVPGPFTRVLVDALRNSMSLEPAKPYVLVVEEINRANMAAVFGDVFQLLDRNSSNVSEYPIHASEDMKKYLADKLGGAKEDYTEIRLPDNMFIWATMNSADQGVFPMDTAFKRRWDFTYLGINTKEEKIINNVVMLGTGSYARIVSWNKLRKAINDKLLTFNVNEDKLMGTFFISLNVLKTIPDDEGEKFRQVFKDKVLMYLFNDAAKRKAAQLFSGCTKSNSYSAIVREFDIKGVNIFDSSIRDQFKDNSDLSNEADEI